jgi:hypothetical protein
MVASSQPRRVRQLPPSANDGRKPRLESCHSGSSLPRERPATRRGAAAARAEILDLGAALLRRQPKLLLGFHTLGTGFHAEAVAQVDHDERPVDFELVEGELLQVAQARVAGAEIVHHEPYPQLAQLLESPQRLLDIADQHILGDLELEPFRRCASLLEAVADHVDEVAVPNWIGETLSEIRAPGSPARSRQA